MARSPAARPRGVEAVLEELQSGALTDAEALGRRDTAEVRLRMLEEAIHKGRCVVPGPRRPGPTHPTPRGGRLLPPAGIAPRAVPGPGPPGPLERGGSPRRAAGRTGVPPRGGGGGDDRGEGSWSRGGLQAGER